MKSSDYENKGEFQIDVLRRVVLHPYVNFDTLNPAIQNVIENYLDSGRSISCPICNNKICDKKKRYAPYRNGTVWPYPDYAIIGIHDILIESQVLKGTLIKSYIPELFLCSISYCCTKECAKHHRIKIHYAPHSQDPDDRECAKFNIIGDFAFGFFKKEFFAQNDHYLPFQFIELPDRIAYREFIDKAVKDMMEVT